MHTEVVDENKSASNANVHGRPKDPVVQGDEALRKGILPEINKAAFILSLLKGLASYLA